MPYPSRDEFSELLVSRDHAKIVEELLITGVPFAFRDSPADYDTLRATLGAALHLSVDAMTVVGSGRIGFSLSPEKYGAPFLPESDLDVAVISAELFDIAWFDLLRLGRKYFRLQKNVRAWVDTHKENHIFFGFIIPDFLPGAVAISPTWFRTFRGLARNPSLADRDVNGRLYQTWNHVLVHQLYSLRKIQQGLRPTLSSPFCLTFLYRRYTSIRQRAPKERPTMTLLTDSNALGRFFSSSALTRRRERKSSMGFL
jgi:hypothetical protein